MAHSDFDAIITAMVPVAKQLVSEHGDFRPFGASMAANGEVTFEPAATERKTALATTSIGILATRFQARAAGGLVRATGICFPARVNHPDTAKVHDAICIGLEHESGESTLACVPYAKRWLGGWKFGTTFNVAWNPKIFGDM